MCETLARFNLERRLELSRYGDFFAVGPGETLIEENEAQDSLYFLIEGGLQAVHGTEDGATPVGVIRKHEWFGEINIFDPSTASARVVARVQSKVWRISRSMLEGFINENPVLGCQLLLDVAQVLARRTRKVLGTLNAQWELGL